MNTPLSREQAKRAYAPWRGVSMNRAIGCAIRDRREFSWTYTRKRNACVWANVHHWYPCAKESTS